MEALSLEDFFPGGNASFGDDRLWQCLISCATRYGLDSPETDLCTQQCVVTIHRFWVVFVIHFVIAMTHVPTMGNAMSVDVANVTCGTSVSVVTAPATAEGFASRMVPVLAMPASRVIDVKWLC